MTRTPTRLGYTLVLVGVVAFSVNAGVSRVVLDSGLDAWTLAGLRAIGASALLGLLVVVTGRRSRLGVDRALWPYFLLYGVVGLGLLQSFYFEAVARIPIGLAVLIEFLAPLWVALWAKMVQHKPVRPTVWPALVITFVGLGIVAGVQMDDLDPVGVLSAFLAGLCFAVYFIVGERLVAAHDPFVVSFWGFGVAAVGWVVAGILTPRIDPAWAVDYSTEVALPAAIGAAVVPVGLLVAWIISLGTVVPFASETAAMRWVPATAVSVLAMLEPVGAAVVGWWWFGQTLTVFQIFGVALVLAGITMALLSRAEHPTPAVVD